MINLHGDVKHFLTILTIDYHWLCVTHKYVYHTQIQSTDITSPKRKEISLEAEDGKCSSERWIPNKYYWAFHCVWNSIWKTHLDASESQISNLFKVLWRCKQTWIYKRFRVAPFFNRCVQSVSANLASKITHFSQPIYLQSLVTATDNQIAKFSVSCIHKAAHCMFLVELNIWWITNEVTKFDFSTMPKIKQKIQNQRSVYVCMQLVQKQQEGIYIQFLLTAGPDGSASSIIAYKNNQMFGYKTIKSGKKGIY